MQLTTLRKGVLKVETGAGARYVELSLKQRLYMLWVFRNFSELPENVMSRREQQLVANVCSEARFLDPVEVDVEAVIGTVERSVVPLPPRKMATNDTSEMKPVLVRRHG